MLLPEKAKPAKPNDFGLWMGKEAAIECFSVYVSKNIMARGGGWLDQPEEWREDMITLMEEFNSISRKLMKEKPGK